MKKSQGIFVFFTGSDSYGLFKWYYKYLAVAYLTGICRFNDNIYNLLDNGRINSNLNLYLG
jgi:hypothetical protein